MEVLQSMRGNSTILSAVWNKLGIRLQHDIVRLYCESDSVFVSNRGSSCIFLFQNKKKAKVWEIL